MPFLQRIQTCLKHDKMRNCMENERKRNGPYSSANVLTLEKRTGETV